LSDLNGTARRPVSRIASFVLVAVYVTGAWISGGPESALTTSLFCIVPTACIWFPEALGDYTGMFLFDSVTKESPPFLVWLFGWLVLLLPVIVRTILRIEGVDLKAVFP
jgi:hypothetical protein